MKSLSLFIGIMSGTSCDGTDIALVDIERLDQISCLRHRHFPWPPAISAQARNLAEKRAWSAQTIISFENEYSQLVGDHLKQFFKQENLSPSVIEAVGWHGLTLAHFPPTASSSPGTFQAANPALLALTSGCPVITDFRRADVALGGEGAPLAAFLDFHFFRSESEHRVLLNLGGIANLTCIPAACDINQVIAFDTGPANMIMDSLVIEHSSGELAFDKCGALARTGRVLASVLQELLNHPYFKLEGPKSTGREDFGKSATQILARCEGAFADKLATACAFTVQTIANALEAHEKKVGITFASVITAGGGVKNSFLMEQLQHRFPAKTVKTTADYAIDPESKEAVLMALLAFARVRKLAANMPSVSGSSRPAILGSITLPAD